MIDSRHRKLVRAAAAALAALGGLALLWAYWVALHSPATGVFHDDGVYLVTAKALAEGKGYTIISLPESPSQTKYPILFPWLLSLVWRVTPSFPDNLPWLRLVPLSSLVLWLYLSWKLVRRCGGSRWAAGAVIALTIVSPWVWFLGTTLLSESLFALLITASSLALTSADSRSRETRLGALAGFLAGACLLTRAAGIALVASGPAWLLWKRRWRGSLAFAAAAAAVAAPWAYWVWGNNASPHDAYYSASPYASWNILFSYSASEKLTILVRNTLYSLVSPGSLWGVRTSPWLFAAGLLVAGLVGRGMWLTRNQPATWLVGAVLGINLMWAWPPFRFIVPIVPMLLWQVSVAARPVNSAVRAACVVALASWSLVATVQAASQARAHGIVWSNPSTADDWQMTSQLLDWVRANTPGNAVLTGNLDPQYFLYTGRQAVRAYSPDSFALFYASASQTDDALGSAEDLRARLVSSHADYILLTPSLGFASAGRLREFVDRLGQRYPGSVAVAAGDPAGGYVIFRVSRNRLTGTP